MADVSISVTTFTDRTALLKAVKEATGESYSQIHHRLSKNLPVAEIRLEFGKRNSPKLLKLLSQLHTMGCVFEIQVDGRPESEAYLKNIIQRAKQISVETLIQTELEVTGKISLSKEEEEEIAEMVDKNFSY